jgi:hypothetical protein
MSKIPGGGLQMTLQEMYHGGISYHHSLRVISSSVIPIGNLAPFVTAAYNETSGHLSINSYY